MSLKAAEYPELIKYMGSKSKIIPLVVEALDEVYNGGVVCDLFAGSCSLSGALKNQVPVVSNDIQVYSKVLANTYLNAWFDKRSCKTGDEIVTRARRKVEDSCSAITFPLDYNGATSLSKFNKLEKQSQQLIQHNFDHDWHLFTKYYSGTWWSTLQCIWIDALREVAEEERETTVYPVILSALMFAMAYASQGTGHYAQYRDANTIDSMKDILIYRNKSIEKLFYKKYNELCDYIPLSPPAFNNIVMAVDYKDCLASLHEATIYADPPYCFVHYSRFYHALETLVLYDFPDIQKVADVMVKGRYRTERHQSPFCIRTKVVSAFEDMFKGVKQTGSNLVLSYSNTGMLPLKELLDLATNTFGSGYKIRMLKCDHKHMTMGRRADRDRDVKEAILIVGRN